MSRLAIGIQRGSALQLYEAMWGPLYEAVLSILGSTGVILPAGDPKHGQPNAATFKTVGEEQVTFTWSEAPNSFDTKLDLTDPDSFQGIIPIIDFNGTDEEADTPDAAYWSRDDAAGQGFSIGAWVNADTGAPPLDMFGKWDSSSGAQLREWLFSTDSSGNLALDVYDESANVGAQRLADASMPIGQWVFVVATYDGGGGATAANGAVLYQDGSSVASTASNNGSYVAMEDLATLPTLAFHTGPSAPAQHLDGKIAGGPLGPFFAQKELTADEVLRLYETGRRALAL